VSKTHTSSLAFAIQHVDAARDVMLVGSDVMCRSNGQCHAYACSSDLRTRCTVLLDTRSSFALARVVELGADFACSFA